MKKRIQFISLLIFMINICNAQNLNWVKQIGGINSDHPTSMAIGNSGNFYIVGDFFGMVDFDPDTGIHNLNASTSTDIFIVKYNSNGNLIWAQKFAPFSISDIALDSQENIYLTGIFDGTVDFDPSAAVHSLSTNPSYDSDIFVLKLDSADNYVWVKKIGSYTGAPGEHPTSLCLDNSGNVILTGSFNGTTDFDPSAATYNLTAAGGGPDVDIFICKLNSSGNFVWAKRIGNSYDSYGLALGTDSSDNVYCTGSFTGTVDFNPGTGTFNLTSTGLSSDIFLLKISSAGAFDWAFKRGNSNNENGVQLSVDELGNSFLAGTFNGTVDFDPNGTFNLTDYGGGDIFLAKYDNSGNFAWAKQIGGSSLDAPQNLFYDGKQNLLMTGIFQDSSDFDPGINSYFLSASGSNDIFITKLDTSGNFIWANGYGGNNVDFGYSVCSDTPGTVFGLGTFQDTALFNSQSNSFTLTSNGSDDIYILKISSTPNLINELVSSDGIINLFPNPSSNHLTISFRSNNKNVEIIITEITGKIIYITNTTGTQKIEVNTNGFANGVYVVQIQTSELTTTRKLMIVK